MWSQCKLLNICVISNADGSSDLLCDIFIDLPLMYCAISVQIIQYIYGISDDNVNYRSFTSTFSLNWFVWSQCKLLNIYVMSDYNGNYNLLLDIFINLLLMYCVDSVQIIQYIYHVKWWCWYTLCFNDFFSRLTCVISM